MEREHFINNFARRIVSLMQERGLGSANSKTGVKVNQIAEIGECSIQMARRYVLGEALPDVDVIYKIAKWLEVSPGWLLFGEDTQVPNNLNQKNLIRIEPDLLEYILVKSAFIFRATDDTKELVSFILDIINDATHVEADKQILMKIIDISINSAMRFNGIKNDKKFQSN